MKPISEGIVDLAPAELAVRDGRLIAGCADETVIELLEVQPEGKKKIAARDFIHGYRLQAGEKLGA